mgnify:CR=1 FL=1
MTDFIEVPRSIVEEAIAKIDEILEKLPKE